ncbi:2Fe-2S iron-sulfur cluster-binding protein [Vitreoscilla massiliensis]|uniref:2Fe-2S iron-sulfur cluster-binding protein n=1 Tax=Vitreoscilla massiliensis TaxID=1689272 RepID=A0ABY4DXZ0_9NEIS|nr:ferredoxin reductase [Vitreoscilla massiliensis]UOO88172.1 2Fe-2S iron-sulfur cluster-binding protein [Vitreoscilla massiliensis]
MPTQTLNARVLKKTQLSERVVGLTLGLDGGGVLPAWEPGAHIELELGASEPLYRQYSLCGTQADTQHWQIAVLKDEASRGGSAYIHEVLQEGDVLPVSVPKNHFPFAAQNKCYFIAGGIGITPIVPMVEAAAAAGLDWQLLYLARSPADFIFLADLQARDAERIHVHASDDDGPYDLQAALAALDAHTTVYSCGPQGLLDALEQYQSQQSHIGWQLVVERFAVAVDEQTLTGNTFTVTLHKSGKHIQVGSDETILAALKREGVRVKCSCQNGTCGTCETVVISGRPEHRDFVLSPEERELNETMMVCVSRALSDELVLDL